MKKYIEKTRRDYVDPYRHFSESFRSSMTDKERDVIENKVQKSLKHLIKNLDVLKEKVVHGNEAPDSVESRKGVLMILFQQMETVSSYFQTQRSKRVQQDHIVKDGYDSLLISSILIFETKDGSVCPRESMYSFLMNFHHQ